MQATGVSGFFHESEILHVISSNEREISCVIYITIYITEYFVTITFGLYIV